MPETLYKLTDHDGYTRRGAIGETLWEIGVTRTASGEGKLCFPGWIHAYTHPLLAILLNPIHADIISPRLFRCDGKVGKTDHGLKVGCIWLMPVEEMAVPVVTTEQRIRFAMLCTKQVWVSDEDRLPSPSAARAARTAAAAAWAARVARTAARAARTAEAVEAAAEARTAAAEAWSAAAESAEAAARAARVARTAEAVEAEAEARTAAAEAVEAAAWAARGKIDLIAIAIEACNETGNAIEEGR